MPGIDLPNFAGLDATINAAALASLDDLADRFRHARPFRHAVIDNFFTPDYCARLLADFPAFETGNARNEAGELGKKSTFEKIRRLGTSFSVLDDCIRSAPFLNVIERITGIPDLLYDPWYFGGGTHENRSGQDLDAHVDFNRHPVEPWHRRLNLIVYLNREWESDWGGNLQLHSDPRARDDEVVSIVPRYNTAVIFETTETSWHGFDPIELPEEKQGLSRKSIALYFYTKQHPEHETASPHSTIYVDRALSPRFRPGHVLSEADIEEIRTLLTRRDHHTQRLYGDITRLTAELAGAKQALDAGFLRRLRYYAGRAIHRFKSR